MAMLKVSGSCRSSTRSLTTRESPATVSPRTRITVSSAGVRSPTRVRTTRTESSGTSASPGAAGPASEARLTLARATRPNPVGLPSRHVASASGMRPARAAATRRAARVTRCLTVVAQEHAQVGAVERREAVAARVHPALAVAAFDARGEAIVHAVVRGHAGRIQPATAVVGGAPLAERRERLELQPGRHGPGPARLEIEHVLARVGA